MSRKYILAKNLLDSYFESLELAFDAFDTLNKLLCYGNFTEEEIKTLRKEYAIRKEAYENKCERWNKNEQ